MNIGKLQINPATNPGVLETCTWDPPAVTGAAGALRPDYLDLLTRAADTSEPLPEAPGFTPFAGSVGRRDGHTAFLAQWADGQQVFLELGSGAVVPWLGQPIDVLRLPGERWMTLHPTDAAVVDLFTQQFLPAGGPRALGAVPRLGIGVRMTTACWPGIMDTMRRGGFAANPIQNSVRELNRLPALLAGEPPVTNYACGFGMIATGYTGSTFEGLWVAGVLAILAGDRPPAYGADADHVQVKRGADGMERARQVLNSARYYSFYTLDLADVLDYSGAQDPAMRARTRPTGQAVGAVARQQFAAYHRAIRRLGGWQYQPDEAALDRLTAKFGAALHAVEELTAHLRALKQGRPFDLEISMDEHPPEVPAFDVLTTPDELAFVLLECRRRELPVTHIAPNLGQEKGVDYRCPDGVEGLERRTTILYRLASEFGVLLDIHSGDDLSSAPRLVIRRATSGRHHFKISPMLQLLFADVLREFDPVLWGEWWNDAREYARREAAAGSAFAAQCLRADETGGPAGPTPKHAVFHHYGFAFVGRRDPRGCFLHREKFYTLSPAFYAEYTRRLSAYLLGLAEEVF